MVPSPGGFPKLAGDGFKKQCALFVWRFLRRTPDALIKTHWDQRSKDASPCQAKLPSPPNLQPSPSELKPRASPGLFCFDRKVIMCMGVCVYACMCVCACAKNMKALCVLKPYRVQGDDDMLPGHTDTLLWRPKFRLRISWIGFTRILRTVMSVAARASGYGRNTNKHQFLSLRAVMSAVCTSASNLARSNQISPKQIICSDQQFYSLHLPVSWIRDSAAAWSMSVFSPNRRACKRDSE